MKASSNGSRARSARPTAQSITTSMQRDLHAIRRDLTGFFEHRMSDVQKGTAELAQNVQGHVSDAVDAARGTAIAVQKKAQSAVKARPMTTIGTAVAAGAIGAMLLGWYVRRDR